MLALKLPKVFRGTFKCFVRKKKYTKNVYVNANDTIWALIIITTILISEFTHLLLANREDGILNMLSPPTY